MRVTTWMGEQPLSLEVLQARYPPKRYRVTPYVYPAGASFGGRTRAGRWFVLGGACQLNELSMCAGEVIEHDAMDYTLRVIGDGALHLVRVWDVASFMK